MMIGISITKKKQFEANSLWEEKNTFHNVETIQRRKVTEIQRIAQALVLREKESFIGEMNC